MPVPKWLLAAIGVIAGFFVLAVLRATMADDQPATEVGPAAIASREPVAPSGESAAQPVNITIVVAQPPVDPAAPAGPAASTTYAVPAAPHAYVGRAPVQAARPRQTPTSFARASAPTPTRGPGAVAYTAAPTRSVNPTPFVVSYLPGAPGPGKPPSRSAVPPVARSRMPPRRGRCPGQLA